jgi:hypothetical protein
LDVEEITYYLFEIHSESLVWWYTPLIPAAEAGGSQVEGQPGLCSETLSQKKLKIILNM